MGKFYTVTAKKEKGAYVGCVHISSLNNDTMDYFVVRQEGFLGFLKREDAIQFGRVWAQEEFQHEISAGHLKEIQFLHLNVK